MNRISQYLAVLLFLFGLKAHAFSFSVYNDANVSIKPLSTGWLPCRVEEKRIVFRLPGSQAGFQSFHVKRVSTKVDLVWETTAECDNSGFEIQRRTAKGDWQKVAFVFAQTVNGSSNSMLSYEYTDVNVLKEGSQYRLKQLNGSKLGVYSEVQSIDGYCYSNNLVNKNDY